MLAATKNPVNWESVFSVQARSAFTKTADANYFDARRDGSKDWTTKTWLELLLFCNAANRTVVTTFQTPSKALLSVCAMISARLYAITLTEDANAQWSSAIQKMGEQFADVAPETARLRLIGNNKKMMVVRDLYLS